MSAATTAGQRRRNASRFRSADAKASGPALTVPSTTWFFSTMSRIRRAGSASMKACMPGTPVSTKIPFVPTGVAVVLVPGPAGQAAGDYPWGSTREEADQEIAYLAENGVTIDYLTGPGAG